VDQIRASDGGDGSMTTYLACMMDAETGAEGAYYFEDGDDLIRQTPVRVIRKFMEHVGKDLLPHKYVDYELNAAFRNDTAHVVTTLGSLMLSHGPAIPFAIMIAPKSADPDRTAA
jgi:hypothetical protein